ncbi:MAG: DUF1190 domain-containing protein [Alphaproteobacteria bacterium]|nr:DUF1190 domain-containing protein [Alphaproteobacteria bacterium]
MLAQSPRVWQRKWPGPWRAPLSRPISSWHSACPLAEVPSMKKSSSVRLVLLGSASMVLAACGDDGVPTDARFFADLKECTAIHGDAACGEAKVEADKVYAAEAPRFTRKQECEAEFGAGSCETRAAADGGSSMFMPLLMGYMIGNALGGNRFNQPVYRGPDNSAVMPRGGKAFNVGNFAGSGVQGASGFRPAAQVTQVARGGFGTTATAFRSTAGS